MVGNNRSILWNCAGRRPIKRLKAMMSLARRITVAIVVLAVWAAGSAAAQENLDKGKTPAQVYASDCAIYFPFAKSMTWFNRKARPRRF